MAIMSSTSIFSCCIANIFLLDMMLGQTRSLFCWISCRRRDECCNGGSMLVYCRIFVAARLP